MRYFFLIKWYSLPGRVYAGVVFPNGAVVVNICGNLSRYPDVETLERIAGNTGHEIEWVDAEVKP